MNIGKAIKDARDAAWMTQEELAMRTTLTLQQIQNIEEGLMEIEYIQRHALDSIASALEIPLEIFFILGIEDSDIAPGKKEIAALLLPSLQGLVKQLIGDKEKD